MTRRLHAINLLVGLGLLLPATAVAAPPLSVDEMIQIAASGVGSPYVWGGGCWDPGNRSWKGADCSGFVAKVWQVPQRSSTTECSHPYTSGAFTTDGSHWTAVDRAAMQRGDALARDGHVTLFVSGDGWGSLEVYEARGSDYGIVHRTRTMTSESKAARRTDLIAPTPTPTPTPTPPPTPDPTQPPPTQSTGLDAQVVQASVGGTIPSGGGQPGLACPGQRFAITVAVRNTGQDPWQVGGQLGAVRLGHAGGESFGAPSRLALLGAQATILPGQDATFVIEGMAPVAPGRYETRWQLISELVGWFGPPVQATVDVSAAPPGAGGSCATGQAGACATGVMQCSASGLVCAPPQGCAPAATPAPGTPAPAAPPGQGAAPAGQDQMLVLSCAVTDAPAAGGAAWLGLALLGLLLRRGRAHPER